MFEHDGEHDGDKLKAWIGYLKEGGLDRPAASIPFDLISTEGATDEMIEFLAGMLTLAALSGPAAAEEAVEGFMRDPENFASDIEIEERMAAMPLSDALDSVQSTDETLMAATTLLHLLGLWQGGQAKLLQPAHTLRKLVLEPDSGRWMSTDEDDRGGEPPTVILSDAEDMAAAELTRFGVGVLLPLSADLPFDLMLHWRGRMLRARIRTARRKDTLTRFSLPAARVDCDVMVLCDDESVYLLKPEEFAGRRGFTIRHRPTRSGRSKGCNFHDDFVVSAERIREVLDVR